MLSRVAERLYWLTRYLERAEDTARLVNAYSQLILDLPRAVEPGWSVLVQTIDASTAFGQRYRITNERNVIKFLLADTDNMSSITYAVSSVRENMRTTRDVLPAQAWELVNEYQLFVEANARASVTREGRFEFLEEVIARSQQLHGLIESSVLRDPGMWFMRLGRLIERADMTSRVLDVGIAAIAEQSEQAEIPLLWANLLKSLSATSAYRRVIGPELARDAVVDFVLRNGQFPRSISYCLASAQAQLKLLDAPADMQQKLEATIALVSGFDAAATTTGDLHDFIDELQLQVADLHDALCIAWFAGTPQR